MSGETRANFQPTSIGVGNLWAMGYEYTRAGLGNNGNLLKQTQTAPVPEHCGAGERQHGGGRAGELQRGDEPDREQQLELWGSGGDREGPGGAELRL